MLIHLMAAACLRIKWCVVWGHGTHIHKTYSCDLVFSLFEFAALCWSNFERDHDDGDDDDNRVDVDVNNNNNNK